MPRDNRGQVSHLLETAVRPLSFPGRGIRRGDLLFRLPTVDDVPTIAPAFLDEDVGGRANMPLIDEETVRAVAESLPDLLARGRFLPLLVTDAASVLGGGTLHRIDRELEQGEIGYWLFPHARGRGVATRTARFLAEHGFSIGLRRIEARVFAGNPESERVLQRAGFTREGILRSLPRRAGGRDDMTLYSLLPGE